MTMEATQRQSGGLCPSLIPEGLVLCLGLWV